MTQERPRFALIPEELKLSEHDIATFKPKYVGEGEEHAVFAIPEHPDVVVKVNTDSLASSIEWHKEHGGTIDDFHLDTDFQSQVEHRLESSRKGLALLRTYFGKEHVPKSRYTKLRIPLLPSLSKRYGIEDTASMPSEIEVNALIQERIPEFESGEFHSLKRFHKGESETDFVNTTFDGVFPAPGSFKEDHPYVLAHPDEREAIIDFIQSAIRYSEDTGKILDVGGSGNVILRKINGAWDYVLVDAMFPVTWQNWLDRAKDNFESYLKKPESFDISKQEANIINSTNYVCFINHMAHSLGLPERLDYFSDIPESEREKLKGLFEKSLVAWRARKARQKRPS